MPRVVLEGGGQRLEDLGGQTSSWHRSGQEGRRQGGLTFPPAVTKGLTSLRGQTQGCAGREQEAPPDSAEGGGHEARTRGAARPQRGTEGATKS